MKMRVDKSRFRLNHTLRYGQLRTLGGMVFFALVVSSLYYGEIRAEVWGRQTERLQVVNASLLDGAPIFQPLQSERFGLGLSADISILPKVNPTVGTKAEKVPQPPVHAIPTLGFSARLYDAGFGDIGFALWGGYLPSAFSKVGGLKSGTFNQSASGFGIPLSVRFAISGAKFSGHFRPWMQSATSDLESKISSAEGNDSFKVGSVLKGLDLALTHPDSGVTGSFTFYSREIDSNFFIFEDSNTIKIRDEQPAYQWAASWSHPLGYRVGLAQIFVPKRIAMTRLHLEYRFEFGGKS